MNKKYQIIYADPPWPIRWVTVPTKSGFKGLEYPTMAIAEMCNLPVKEISAECSKCFVWTTNHFLLEGLFLIRSWGFQFDKLWVWCKKTGAGGHPRTSTEYVIEGTKGLLKSIGGNNVKATNNWFIASKGKHSVKPEVVRDMIDRFYPNCSKIELFARQKALGWDCLGFDVDGKDIKQSIEELSGD